MSAADAAQDSKRGRESLPWILALFAACSLPFLTRAFNMDDPLFIWTARNILKHPWDFYGFDVNWYGVPAPISDVMKNPPLASYALAGVGALFGFGELPLHAALLLPALGTVLGTYLLARELCQSPGQAALAAAFTPAFFVSSTTVMCDVLTLCAWVWALYAWKRGQDGAGARYFVGAALCICVAEMTKYVGVSLIGLVTLYSVLRRRRLDPALAWLLLPLAVLAVYQWATRHLYAHGLLLDAAAYSFKKLAHRRSALSNVYVSLVYLGGSLLSALFYAPWVCGRRTLALAAVALPALTWLFLRGAALELDPGGAVQAALFLLAGVLILSLAVQDFLSTRSPEAAVLLAWVLGVFGFAAWLNWTVNARSLLPMAPAVGLLLLRAAERRGVRGHLAQALPLVGAGAVALVATFADAKIADCDRDSARALVEAALEASAGAHFEGHWGFQYYAELAGAHALDLRRERFKTGDLVFVPLMNTNTQPLPAAHFAPLHHLSCQPLPFAATMDAALHAGFYSDRFGALPFAFGRASQREYAVLRATP